MVSILLMIFGFLFGAMFFGRFFCHYDEGQYFMAATELALGGVSFLYMFVGLINMII